MKIIYVLTGVLLMSAATQSFGDMPAIGDDAPAFAGMKDDGYTISLGDYAGKWLALYFYPKADTPGCTKQACSLRDAISELSDDGIEILGVSVDSVKAQAAFRAKYNLPFPLLADEEGEVTAMYGVNRPLIPMAKRVTFIISPEGKIADIIEDVKVSSHAEQVRDSLTRLKSEE